MVELVCADGSHKRLFASVGKLIKTIFKICFKQKIDYKST